MAAIIRSMEQKDIEGVQAAAAGSWDATYEGIIPRDVQDRFLAAAYNSDMLVRRMDRSVMLVAEEEGRIAGFANFTPVNEGGTAELSAIYLLPEKQGTGTGTALLERGIGMLPGLEVLEVIVEKKNDIGLQFYSAKGFRIEEVFDEDFDGHLLQSVRMRKRLDGGQEKSGTR